MSQNDNKFQSKGKKFGGGGKGRDGGGRGGFGKKFEGDRPRGRSEGGGYKGKSDGFKKPYRDRDAAGGDKPYKKREWSGGGDRPERSGGDRPFKKPFRARPDGGGRDFKSGGEDRPYKKREWSDRPERSGGDRPFKKPFRDRDAGGGGDRPFKKPYRDRDAGGGGDRPFKKPFRDRDGGGDRPFKKPYREGDKPYKTFGDRADRAGGDRPFKKPFRDRDAGGGGDRPFKKPFRDRDAGAASGGRDFKGGDRPFKKREDDGKQRFKGDTHKPYKRNFDNRDFDARPKKSFSVRESAPVVEDEEEGLGFELNENNEMVETAPGEGHIAAFDAKRRLKSDRTGFGTPSSAFLYGAHAVKEALQNPKRVMQRLLVTRSGLAHIQESYDLARNTGLKVPEPHMVEAYDIERLLPRDAVHQGVLLDTQPLEETFLADILIGAGDNARVLVLDQVTDPHNVGAILRSAAAFGAAAVIVQKLHAPDVTGTLAKSASGAVEHVPIVRETNLSRAIEQLKEAGFFCIGLDERGKQTVAEAAKDGGKVALVLGAEGDGLRRLVAETCDVLAKLPTQGAIASLNVSNAAAVALYELVRNAD